ncbi:hypothetical protein M231_00438 [Tremella mesenterica]|uniref:Uncharacterized protein n=1 Tax=Tremella mesenterica TaxID=5217 RepID=A0A4Q1BVA0_TREME|nr:hypothetical protein M231_00438 [Tremella mesenterica]
MAEKKPGKRRSKAAKSNSADPSEQASSHPQSSVRTGSSTQVDSRASFQRFEEFGRRINLSSYQQKVVERLHGRMNQWDPSSREVEDDDVRALIDFIGSPILTKESSRNFEHTKPTLPEVKTNVYMFASLPPWQQATYVLHQRGLNVRTRRRNSLRR